MAYDIHGFPREPGSVLKPRAADCTPELTYGPQLEMNSTTQPSGPHHWPASSGYLSVCLRQIDSRASRLIGSQLASLRPSEYRVTPSRLSPTLCSISFIDLTSPTVRIAHNAR